MSLCNNIYSFVPVIWQVLAAVVKRMSLQEILDNMGFLASRHVLEPTFPAASDIAQRIGEQQQVQEEK